MRRFTLALIAATSLLASVSASALTAKQIVEKETVVQMPDGSETVTRSKAANIAPGERVVYTLSFTNDKVEPASDLVLTMPVPDEIKYMDGTASQEGASIVFSADGGQTFAPRDNLQTSTGGVTRTATADDITHIRWTVAGPVAAGETGNLSYKGVLK